jgi:hypothetical protein
VGTDSHLVRCLMYIDLHPMKCRLRPCLQQDFTG